MGKRKMDTTRAKILYHVYNQTQTINGVKNNQKI
jgi:hypothetical protein